MQKLSLIFCLLLISGVCPAQKANVIKLDKLQPLLTDSSSTVLVINFWATWCAPCVKELPLFEALHAEGRSDVKITLISLDYSEKLDRVNAFLKRKQMKAPVFLLDEIDYNKWINLVDKSWSGAIPATLIINSKTNQRKFVERELADGELESLVAEVL